ncbi:unnamed protein product [Diamesa serratosioi]
MIQSASSDEDEMPSNSRRLDSFTSYTSEDELKTSSTKSEELRNIPTNYYNKPEQLSTDEESHNNESRNSSRIYENDSDNNQKKRTFSSNSEETDDQQSHKRKKFASESTDSEPSGSFYRQNSYDPSGSSNHRPEDYQNEDETKNKQHYESIYSNKSMRMMKMMGYKEDTGLGRLGQGRIVPIEASQQRGRRGLGLRLDELDAAAIKWDANIEEINIPERVEWLINNGHEDELSELNTDILTSWIHRDVKKLTIDNETKFCDETILKKILESKSVFDKLGAEDMRRARTKSNPFETIRGNIFVNRAAVKMANMDSMLDFMFTNPIDENGKSLVNEKDLLFFADVCAGPGGFTEYLLWRKKWLAKGFGFTLKSDNDFKLYDFFAGHPETFCPYYGVNGDGNVYDPENIESLTKLVVDETESGVHFMMADGGFSVEGQENIQEILSKQLYLSQCLVALSIVRTKGHFVVKLFDLFTPFSVSLVYLMYKCFQQICICKPNTSRPANSERYLVCKWKKPYTETIQRHLFGINSEMWENKDSPMDVLEMVPLSVMQQDKEFYDYIFNSNNIIGKNQIVGLLKIAAFCHDNELTEKRQPEIRKKCIGLWKLPDEMRRAPIKKTSDQYFANLLEPKWLKEKFYNALERPLESLEHVKGYIHSIQDWYFVGVDINEKSSKNRTFFMSKGRFDVLMYNMNNGSWEPVQNLAIEMSPESLVYGEIVKELTNEGRSQISKQSFHIIDGIILGGRDIRHLPLCERNQLCQQFAKSLSKPQTANFSQNVQIRCKRLFRLSDVESYFHRLEPRKLKDNSEKLAYNLRTNDNVDRFHIPRGLLMLNELRSDKIRCFSTKSQKNYYYDKNTRTTEFEDKLKTADIFASFKNTFTNRLIWSFDIKEQIMDRLDPSRKLSGYLYLQDLLNFIQEKGLK